MDGTNKKIYGKEQICQRQWNKKKLCLVILFPGLSERLIPCTFFWLFFLKISEKRTNFLSTLEISTLTDREFEFEFSISLIFIFGNNWAKTQKIVNFSTKNAPGIIREKQIRFRIIKRRARRNWVWVLLGEEDKKVEWFYYWNKNWDTITIYLYEQEKKLPSRIFQFKKIMTFLKM